MNNDVKEHDVIIVGAGMVGAALAVALGQQGLKVVVVNNSEPQLHWAEGGYDLRVSAITHASQRLFESLGAWRIMQQERISPYREMHVWDATGEGVIHFDAADLGEADLGHIVENRVILKGLHTQLASAENVDTIWPADAASLRIEAGRARLVLQDGREFGARVIVGADGGRSWVRQQAGIDIKGHEYDHTAVVTYVKPEKFHQETAWQRFLPSGPLAFLPLSDGYCSIVWSTAAGHAKQLLELDAPQFARELQAAFENTLGAIETVGPRAAFPLRYFETQHYIQPRLALVGDAAHMMHPLAGQGVNLGLADVASLVEVLSAAQRAKRDIGSIAVLRRYERWRRADNRGMLLAMDGLKRLFSSRMPLLQQARNFGLNLADHLQPVKKMLMQRALG